MPREAHIPLFLWITTASVVHAVGGSGAMEAARTLQDRASVLSMVQELRADLADGEGGIEVLTETTQVTPQASAPPVENPNAKPDPSEKPPEDKPDPPKKPPPPPKKPPPPPKKAEPPKKIEPPKPIAKPKPPPILPLAPKPAVANKPPPPPPPPAPPAPKKAPEEVAKKEEVAPPKPPPPPPPPDRRIAVVQDVAKDQPDNPNAKRASDQANTTKEETMARALAYDGAAKAKLEGGAQNALSDPGNADETQAGHNEVKVGREDKAPGEKNPAAVSTAHTSPAPPTPQPQASTAGVGPSAGAPLSVPGHTGGGGKQVSLTPPSNTPAQEASPGGAGPASPEGMTAAGGSWSLDPANPGGNGTGRIAGPKREAVFQSPVSVQSIGLGKPGLPGGPNINLTFASLGAVVGEDKLKQERAGDGEARRARHRGSGDKEKLTFQAAVQNYDPSVKPGNQTSLNAAKVPFASYINAMHNRIHPIFADQFLSLLSNLPPGHALNQGLVAHVEVVLNKDDGRIVRAGISKASGNTAFDVASLGAVYSAAPFGKAPDAIASHDGRVYVHWEFHRDPFDACSSRNAHPYMLKAPEKKTETPVETPKPTETPPADEHKDPPSGAGPIPLPESGRP